jgi:hypothetical protein
MLYLKIQALNNKIDLGTGDAKLILISYTLAIEQWIAKNNGLLKTMDC